MSSIHLRPSLISYRCSKDDERDLRGCSLGAAACARSRGRVGAKLSPFGHCPVNFSSQAADLASELPLKVDFSAEVILA
jgi:hypothetical protein